MLSLQRQKLEVVSSLPSFVEVFLSTSFQPVPTRASMLPFSGVCNTISSQGVSLQRNQIKRGNLLRRAASCLVPHAALRKKVAGPSSSRKIFVNASHFPLRERILFKKKNMQMSSSFRIYACKQEKSWCFDTN